MDNLFLIFFSSEVFIVEDIAATHLGFINSDLSQIYIIKTA